MVLEFGKFGDWNFHIVVSVCGGPAGAAARVCDVGRVDWNLHAIVALRAGVSSGCCGYGQGTLLVSGTEQSAVQIIGTEEVIRLFDGTVIETRCMEGRV